MSIYTVTSEMYFFLWKGISLRVKILRDLALRQMLEHLLQQTQGHPGDSTGKDLEAWLTQPTN